MDAQKPDLTAKTCPKCGSCEYQFRSRKKLPAEPKKGDAGCWETTYRCKVCTKQWKVRTPA
jgi:hypothetical protein